MANDQQIKELIQRAAKGQPFGCSRDINLLIDVICDRLSSRLCHRCLRETSNPEYPGNLSSVESCKCVAPGSSMQHPRIGTLEDGRQDRTMLTSTQSVGLYSRSSLGGSKETSLSFRNEIDGVGVEHGHDDRIKELIQRATYGRPFGSSQDINLLLDIICDRLSRRLCHRCFQEAGYRECLINLLSSAESCGCAAPNKVVHPQIVTLVEGRDEITQTRSAIVTVPYVVGEKTASISHKPSQLHRVTQFEGNDDTSLDAFTQTSTQRLSEDANLSLNMWTQTNGSRHTLGSVHQVFVDTTTDWTTDSETDYDESATADPDKTVQFYKHSFKRLKKKFLGQEDHNQIDSETGVDHRVGRILESSPNRPLVVTNGQSPQHVHEEHYDAPSTIKTTYAKSFRFGNPVLEHALSGDHAEVPSATEPDAEVKEEHAKPPAEKGYPESPCGMLYDLDMTAFLELHHLDVPITMRGKGMAKTIPHRQRADQAQTTPTDRGNSSRRSVRFVEDRQSDAAKSPNGNRRSQVKTNKTNEEVPQTANFKPLTGKIPDDPTKTKHKFHQGALNQVPPQKIRQMSWREKAHVDRKAKFFENRAAIAAMEKQAMQREERKMSGVTESMTERRVSFFEGMVDGCAVN